MATVVNTYKVSHHFEQGGKNSSPQYNGYVQAAAGDYNSIKAVLSSNSLLRQGTLVIDSVQEVGHADTAKG
jgi:hypothetical protein